MIKKVGRPKGTTQSKSAKRKISDARKRNNVGAKKCVVYRTEFKSIADAAREYRVVPSTIHYYLNSDNYPDCYYV